jgi:hypothetical protein
MTLPIETPIAPGVVLVNIAHLLPRLDHKHFATRNRPVTTLFVHHSGTQSQQNVMAWATNMATWHTKHKKWPAIGYHYIIPREPELSEKSDLCVFRVGSEYTVRAHTRLCNRFSSGVCLQGHLGRDKPSHYQLECLEAFIPWWMQWHGRDPRKDLGWHSNSWKWGGIPKLACPGKYMVEWLEDYRDLS